MSEHEAETRKRVWKMFFEGEELFGAQSFNLTLPKGDGDAHVQVKFNDPKMPGAVIRLDYALDKIEPNHRDISGKLEMHLHLKPYQTGISYDPHRIFKTDFKKGKPK